MEKLFPEIVKFIKERFPNNSFITLHEPFFLGNEKKYVEECIDSRFVSSVGKFVNRFEEDIQRYTGAAYAVATVNGTAALHTALLLAGVRNNDFVITQPLSFISTCNAISYIGASPVFIDVDKDTLSLSPEKMRSFLKNECAIGKDGYSYHRVSGKLIRACVLMHTFGHPGRADELGHVCREHNIAFVEDAAESIGSFYNGVHTGIIGLVGVFSFNGNKTITCGGGGVLITNDECIARKAKHITTQAKVPHAWEFSHDIIGYNYRMPNINAALACAQLEQIESFILNKRDLAREYKNYFTEKEIHFITEPVNTRSNYWLNAILLNSYKERESFLRYTNNNGVMTRPVWKLMNKLDMFKDCLSGPLDNALYIEDRLVNIPSSIRIN